MQITIHPLQIVSRVVAVCIVALPMAALHRYIDEAERQDIAGMNRQQLVAFVEEVHSASFLGAYLRAALMTLPVVLAVELIALGIRSIVGLFLPKRQAYVPDDEFSVRVDPERLSTGIKAGGA
jgi:hypothetical protein